MEPVTNPFVMALMLLVMAGCGLLGFTTVVTDVETSGPVEVTEIAVPSGAANADVVEVRAVQTGAETWTFHVTVAHPDTGWDDYADGWDVVLPGGTVIKPDPDSVFTRRLLHPHVEEQPFTRSQSGIVIPPGTAYMTVRAHDLIDGYGGREITVDLGAASGEGFTVERLD